MDKNTVWAIVLSALVLFASIFIQNKYFAPRTLPDAVQTAEVAAESGVLQNNAPSAVSVAVESASGVDKTADVEEVLEEKEYTIETQTLRVRFTNRGGDIIGYELKEHLDGADAVQMAKNISSTNRAFSLAFGNSTSTPINDLFNVKIIDDKTIGFYKEFSASNVSGEKKYLCVGKAVFF